MRITSPQFLTAIAVLLATNCCFGGDPSPSYKHLKFLEPWVGQRQVNEIEDGTSKGVGVESCQWILNKSFLLAEGWGSFEDRPVKYMFITGWNAKTQEMFQWGAGGNADIYGYQTRTGKCDPTKKVWDATSAGIISNGVEHTSDLKLAVQDGNVKIDFTNGKFNDDPVPDVHVEFSREIDVTAPEFDTELGPAHKQLKPISWLVGNWQVHGTWADGKPHVGGETSQWVYNKNYIRGSGWWNNRTGERVEYSYLITWDLKQQKYLMAICDNGGGHAIRFFTRNPESGALVGRDEGVSGEGKTASGDVRFRWVGGKIEAAGTNMIADGQSVPDLEVTFTKK